MSVSSTQKIKPTAGFFKREIDGFLKPFNQRCSRKEEWTCQWIKNLEEECQRDINPSLKQQLEAANQLWAKEYKNILWKKMAIGALGLGLGLGAFAAVIVGGGVLSIALGILAAIGGIAAGCFLGRYAARQETDQAEIKEFEIPYRTEIEWMQTKQTELETQVNGSSGEDKTELESLQKHFKEVLEKSKRVLTKKRSAKKKSVV